VSDTAETVEAVAPEAAAPAATPEPSPSDDLRSAISAAWAEVEGRTETQDETPEPETEDAPERDERGRFVGKEQEAAPDEVQAEAPEATRPALPPELEPVKSVLDEFKPLYESRGLPPSEAVRALFQAQRALQERPYEAIQLLARDFGVDLTKFAPQPAPNDPNRGGQTVQEPNYAALMQKVQQLEGAIVQREQAAEQAAAAQINQTIQQFASDPKHTHFPAVRQMMGALMQAGTANDLATAYEMACRAHPEVFKAIQQAEQAARAKADTAARSQAAAQAKAKAVSVRGSPAVNGFTKPPETLRETIQAAFAGRLN
jgi:hypothetical protein